MDQTAPLEAIPETSAQTKSGALSSIVGWLGVLGGGLLIGAIGGATMILVFALLRWGPGIAPPPESIPDRLAPTIKIHDFFQLINKYGGYNGLKRFGVWTGIRAMFGAGLAVGVIYAAIAEIARRRKVSTWRGISRWNIIFAGAALLIVWFGTVVALWPVLWSNFRGVPPMWARPLTIVGLLIGYLSLALVLVLGHRFIFRTRGWSGHVDRPNDTVATYKPFAYPMPRRAFIGAAAAVLAGFAGYRVIRRLEDQAVFTYDGLRPRGASLDAITPIEKFYVVTKNVIDPQVSKDLWRFSVYGHVNDSQTWSFDDLSAMPMIDQETTLCCISNQVGDILMSNAVWTGIPLHTLVDPTGIKEGAIEVALHAVDGYTDTIPVEVAINPDTLLAFKINGKTLPDRHGYPARLVVPGYFGEKNLKWVTGIEVVDKPVKGFYEQQGWGPSFIVPTRSLYYVPEMKNGFKVGKNVNLRGIAFAGNRGVTSVEVSLDGGTTWLAAKIDYPGTRLTWSLWSYQWVPQSAGTYDLTVRATDGTGELQTSEKRSIVSEGATGYHHIKPKVTA